MSEKQMPLPPTLPWTDASKPSDEWYDKLWRRFDTIDNHIRLLGKRLTTLENQVRHLTGGGEGG